MIIRLATPFDTPALARLRYDFRAAQDPPVEREADFIERCERWMRDRLGQDGRWRCWVADDDGTLIGTLWLQLIEKMPNPVGEPEYHGYITSVYVEPARRNAGIASQLLRVCMVTASSLGIDALILWPSPRSRDLYTRQGFAVRDDIFELRLARQ